MATVSVINSEGLELSGNAKRGIMRTYEYSMFGDLPDDLKGCGLMIDSQPFLEKFSAKDEAGVTMATPCPSQMKEWVRIMEVNIKDIVQRGVGKPRKIHISGSNRPMFCQRSEESGGGYYSACCCEMCATEADMEVISDIMYVISDKGCPAESGYLAKHEEFQKIMRRRTALSEKFDEGMKKAVLKQFPKAEVSFYVDVKTPFYPGSFSMDRKDYAIYPNMTGPGYAGELLLMERDDFQLAAVMMNGGPLLLNLPMDVDDGSYDEFPDDLQGVAATLFGERASTREVAERFLNAMCGGGV